MAHPKKVKDFQRPKPRTSRACDDCRMRKTKCDGSEPCRTCERYGRECTYFRPTQRKRSYAVYVLELEKQVAQLRNTVQALLSQVKLKDLPVELQAAVKTYGVEPNEDTDEDLDEDRQNTVEYDRRLETMIVATGRMSVDERGNCSYKGQTAGLTLLEGIRERCVSMLQDPSEKEEAPSYLPEAFDKLDLSIPHSHALAYGSEILPCKENARELVIAALDDACCLISFVHRPTFDRLFNQVYDTKNDYYSKEERSFLPILYEVLALGYLFLDRSQKQDSAESSFQCKSFRYYQTGRNQIDPAGCCDLNTLQAIIFITMYMQSSGRLSACHSYLSVAIASALRMGIHRAGTPASFTTIEQETRKRIMWALYTMDVYVAAMLGLPQNLSHESIDQTLPLEVADIDIRDDIIPIARSHNPSFATVNAHTKLIVIMSSITNELFSPKADVREQGGPYLVEYSRIVEFENKLEEWHRGLPAEINPREGDFLSQIRAHLRLRLAYAHVQMVLYRPFLHHILREKHDEADLRSFACASACVKAAMQVIWIVGQLDNQQLIAGPFWLTIYTTYFAAMSLLLFALGSNRDPTVDDSLEAAEKARQILHKLAKHCPMANSCATSLTSLSDMILKRSSPSKLPSLQSSNSQSSAEEFPEELEGIPFEAQTTWFSYPYKTTLDATELNSLTKGGMDDFCLLASMDEQESNYLQPYMPSILTHVAPVAVLKSIDEEFSSSEILGEESAGFLLPNFKCYDV